MPLGTLRCSKSSQIVRKRPDTLPFAPARCSSSFIKGLSISTAVMRVSGKSSKVITSAPAPHPRTKISTPSLLSGQGANSYARAVEAALPGPLRGKPNCKSMNTLKGSRLMKGPALSGSHSTVQNQRRCRYPRACPKLLLSAVCNFSMYPPRHVGWTI